MCIRYGVNGNRDKSYTVNDYYKDFASYMAQLHAAVPELPMHSVQGADYCCDTAWQAVLGEYVTQFTDELFRVGVHHYPVRTHTHTRTRPASARTAVSRLKVATVHAV